MTWAIQNQKGRWAAMKSSGYTADPWRAHPYNHATDAEADLEDGDKVVPHPILCRKFRREVEAMRAELAKLGGAR